MCASGFVDLTKAFDQPTLVHLPHLIQHNLAGFALETNRDTSRIWSTFEGKNRDILVFDVTSRDLAQRKSMEASDNRNATTVSTHTAKPVRLSI